MINQTTPPTNMPIMKPAATTPRVTATTVPLDQPVGFQRSSDTGERLGRRESVDGETLGFLIATSSEQIG